MTTPKLIYMFFRNRFQTSIHIIIETYFFRDEAQDSDGQRLRSRPRRKRFQMQWIILSILTVMMIALLLSNLSLMIMMTLLFLSMLLLK